MTSRFLSFKKRGDLGGREVKGVLGKSIRKRDRRKGEKRRMYIGRKQIYTKGRIIKI